jgi:Uma2 family endonuclease
MYNDNNCSFNPLAVLESIKEPRRYTLAEYLKKEERAKEPNEYYNGLITKRTMAKGPHNMVVANMTGELKIACRASGKKYSIFGSQQLIYLPELNFSLYPDVLVVAETPQYWDKNEVLLVNPVLIVEVLSSSSTSKYDRTGKFDEYKTLTSFKEYVLIDPNKCRIETRFRDAPNIWRDTIYKNLSDIIKLESIDCEINADFIYENITFKK